MQSRRKGWQNKSSLKYSFLFQNEVFKFWFERALYILRMLTFDFYYINYVFHSSSLVFSLCLWCTFLCIVMKDFYISPHSSVSFLRAATWRDTHPCLRTTHHLTLQPCTVSVLKLQLPTFFKEIFSVSPSVNWETILPAGYTVMQQNVFIFWNCMPKCPDVNGLFWSDSLTKINNERERGRWGK